MIKSESLNIKWEPEPDKHMARIQHATRLMLRELSEIGSVDIAQVFTRWGINLPDNHFYTIAYPEDVKDRIFDEAVN